MNTPPKSPHRPVKFDLALSQRRLLLTLAAFSTGLTLSLLAQSAPQTAQAAANPVTATTSREDDDGEGVRFVSQATRPITGRTRAS